MSRHPISRAHKALAVFGCLITVLFPSARPAAAEVNLWPVLELTEEQTTVLYPLFVRDRQFVMVFPFYYRTVDAREHHILWPFLKVKDGRIARAAPLWFSDNEGEFTLFPLIFKRKSGTTVTIPPMTFGADGELEGVLPVYAKWGYPGSNGERHHNLHLLWPLYSKSEVRADNGAVVSRYRRWLLFSDNIDRTGKQTLRILGIPISERIGG